MSGTVTFSSVSCVYDKVFLKRQLYALAFVLRLKQHKNCLQCCNKRYILHAKVWTWLVLCETKAPPGNLKAWFTLVRLLVPFEFHRIA